MLLTRTRRTTALTTLVAAAMLGVTACSGDDPGAAEPPSESPSTSPSQSPTADVSVPSGVELTMQGTDLSFGETATVVYEPPQSPATVLDMTVEGAREASIDDFSGFVLDDPYKKKANYYYVQVSVENVGKEDAGGEPVPLWGVNGENTLLPPVSFTTKFDKCASTPLPEEFPPGDSVDTCLVYLSPDEGALDALSFRPDQAYDPIEWTGDVQPPKEPKKKEKKQRENS